MTEIAAETASIQQNNIYQGSNSQVGHSKSFHSSFKNLNLNVRYK